MDIRRQLPAGTRLCFPGMECTVQALAGRGSNSFVYEGSYPDHQLHGLSHRVLIKELFPYHPDGAVFRAPGGEIVWESEAEEAIRLHRISFQRGNEVHLRLLRTFPSEIGANLNTFPLNHTLYTVLGFSGGRSLEHELETADSARFSLSRHIRRLLGAADALELFHRSGYLHLDISPDNLLLTGDGKSERVSLIDFNTVHTVQEVRDGGALYYSEKEGYTAPEVRAGNMRAIGFCSDLYSLTAVFYRCIAGKALTVVETSQAGPPDVSGFPCAPELPETALSMLKHILRRGLAAVPGRRYQDVSQLRNDLNELQDRVDGKGITHWALWEAGKRDISRIIRQNPSFSHLRSPDTLYPIQCRTPDGAAENFTEAFRRLLQPEGKSVLLLGSGGMGKTTAVLSAVAERRSAYSAAEPAVAYLPLYGWPGGGTNELKNRLLQMMLFKPHTADMEMARHELLQLLATPAHTRWGERPRLILLLDGLNEAAGDTAPLKREICELAALPGVRVCVSSRVGADLPGFQSLELTLLEESDVRRLLSESGLVPPEEAAMLEALRTPMMLAMYIRAARQEKKQVRIASQDELLSVWLSALIRKASQDAGQDGAAFWQAEAAVRYVLPALVKTMRDRHAAVSDGQLLPAVERCWLRLSRKELRKAFPEWIGHISAIRGDCADAEAWYGEIVHGLLWKRMGLIVRDALGNNRLFHNLPEEYLLGRFWQAERAFRRGQAVRAGACAAVLAGLLGLSYRFAYLPYRQSQLARQPQAYNREQTKTVLGTAARALVNSANQCSRMLDVFDALRAAPVSMEEYRRCRDRCLAVFGEREQIRIERALGWADELMSTGDVMPFSGKPLNRDGLEALLRMGDVQEASYRLSLETLDYMLGRPELWERYGPDYLKELSVALDADLGVLKKRYAMVLEPELSAMANGESLAERVEYDALMDTLAVITPLEMDTIQTYERIQFVAWNAVAADPIHALMEKGNETP